MAYTIQEMVKRTGVSARTFRHYDALGLLEPVGYTEGGHRLYDEESMRRLQTIVFLKLFGVPLKEMKTLLDEPSTWSEHVTRQLRRVREQMNAFAEMERLLVGALHSAALDDTVDLETLQQLVQWTNEETKARATVKEEATWKRLDALPNVNRTDPDSLEWIGLIGQVQRALDRDVSPADRHVQQLIRRMKEKTEGLGWTDEEAASFWRIRQSSDLSARFGLYPLSDALIEYVEIAWTEGENHDDR